jgi:pimeloyl-ACP methyl ester carboxylesterase
MKMLTALLIGGSLVLAGPALAEPQLYKGEKVVTAAGFPTVAWFRKGDADKPLIVFAPGGHHMARIAYGGHEGSKEQDFLAHWLGQKGYSFLALSYPIDTKAFETKHPEFTAQDWGKQVAELAAATIKENGLSNQVALVAWSMGGKVVQPGYQAMTEAGLDVEAAISFAATPGTPGLIALVTNMKMAESGYADRRNIYGGWLKQLEKNNADNGGRTIIPAEVFQADYVGDIPISLQGYGEVYRDGKFVVDLEAQAKDYGAFAYEAYPLVVILEDDDVADARHALADRANWTLFNANTVMARFVTANKVKLNELEPTKWDRLVSLTRGLDERLAIPVGGNHFFFVGEAGAKKAADAIAQGLGKAREVEAELNDILGLKAN